MDDNTGKRLSQLGVVVLVSGLVLAVFSAAITPIQTHATGCPGLGYIAKATAVAIARGEADFAGFANATVTSAQQMTGEQAWRERLLNVDKRLGCVWYITMSGSIPDYFDGTPTPDAYTEMHVAVDATTSVIDSAGYNQSWVFVTTATITPTYTPTSGPSRTPTSTPTPRGTPTPTPTP